MTLGTGTTSQSELTDEQRSARDLARSFAAERITPNASEWDRTKTFDRSLYAEMGELGLMGVCIPEELGGAGLDFVSYILVLEELSRADAGVGVTLAVHTSAATLPILSYGTDAQRQELVPPLASGERIGAFALTESNAGSDAGSLRTTATLADDGASWTINGTKQWITNGSHSDSFVLFARTEPDTRGASGVTCFWLSGSEPGFSVTREEDKLGLNSSSTADLALSDVTVDAQHVLGERSRGFRIAMSTLDGGRIGIAAQAIGIAQAALDVAVGYAGQREQFGKAIGGFQGIQFKLADMATDIAAARQLTLYAARLRMAGKPHTTEGAQAKLFASRMAQRVTSDALQVLGGYGYTKEFPVERYYRDARITEIYEGTSEIQRIVIARSLLGDIVGRG